MLATPCTYELRATQKRAPEEPPFMSLEETFEHANLSFARYDLLTLPPS